MRDERVNLREDSKLTASVHLCDLLTAEPLINIAKLFESLTECAQAHSSSPHNENNAQMGVLS